MTYHVTPRWYLIFEPETICKGTCMRTYKMLVKMGNRSPIWIEMVARDYYHAKELVCRMYGNDCQFYQYTSH